MAYLTFLTAAGHKIAISPKRQESTFRSFQDGLIGESRLSERELPYNKYRAKRGCQREAQSSISIVRSAQKELDRLDDNAFANLDEGLLSLSKRPKPARSKPKCFMWFLGDLRLAAVGDYSVVYSFDEKAMHLRILNVGLGTWVRRRRKSTKALPTKQRARRHYAAGNVRQRGMRETRLKRTDRFIGYSGETAEELLSYPPQTQHRALVEGFREGIQAKVTRKGERALTKEEGVVLTVTALEQEVNNGGFDQFFRNASRMYVSRLEDSLLIIRCIRIAKLAKKAVAALRLSTLSVKKIDAAMAVESPDRDSEFERCNQQFYRAQTRQNIAKHLYTFIRANKATMRF